MGESSQTISGNGGLVGEIELHDFQWKTRDFFKKHVNVTAKVGEVEGGEIGKSLEKAREKRVC